MMSKLIAIFSFFALVGISFPAEAKSIEDTLGGTIVLTTKSFPKTLTSASSIKALHQNKYEYTKKNGGVVTINYMAFLKKAIEGISADVTLFDITSGTASVVQSSEFYTSDRGQRIYSSYFVFDESKVPGDKKYRLVFSYHGVVLAKTEFFLKATPVKYDGKVEFKEEDTK